MKEGVKFGHRIVRCRSGVLIYVPSVLNSSPSPLPSPFQVNERLTEMDIKLLKGDLGAKDYSVVQDGDVVILPAFGATIQEMQFLDAK